MKTKRSVLLLQLHHAAALWTTWPPCGPKILLAHCQLAISAYPPSHLQAVAAHKERMQATNVFDRGVADGVDRGQRNRHTFSKTKSALHSGVCSKYTRTLTLYNLGSVAEDSDTGEGRREDQEGREGAEAVAEGKSVASATSASSGECVVPHKMVRVSYGHGAHGALGPKYMYVVVPEGQEVQDVLPDAQVADVEVVSQVGAPV